MTLSPSPIRDQDAASPTVLLDRFELLEEIGRGAMGVVYLAQDAKLDRLVALKTLDPAEWPEEGRESAVAAAMREARLAGTLNHPGIVTVHDFIEPGNGEPPLVAMEHIRGTSLRELLKGGQPLPADFVAKVVSQAAEALDHAHARGVVHRDIKPANLMITPDERVKITDFGIAHSLAGPADGAERLRGTPSYVAPEILQRRPADPRSDVFSLGVVACEMLTGRTPFTGRSAAEVVRGITDDPFPPPAGLAAELPEPILRTLARALEKEPDARYASAGAFAADLRRHLAARPDAASSPSAPAPGVSLPRSATPHPPEDSEASTQDLSPYGAQAPERARPTRRPPAAAPARQAPDPAATGIGFLTKRAQLILPAALVTLVVLVAMVWFVAWWSSAAEPREDEAVLSEHRLRLQYVPLLKEGLALLRAGEPEAAARVFSIAEKLAPGRPEIAALRNTAEERAAERDERERLEHEMAILLESAATHLEAGRFRQAAEAAESALALDPEAPAAGVLRRQARAGLARRAAAARSAAAAEELPEEPAGPAAEAVEELAEIEPEPPAEPPLPWVDLKIDFFSRRSRGVLTIYAGADQLLRRPFRFVRKSGFLRREPTSGRIEASRILPTGPISLRVYVALPDRETVLETLETELGRDGPRLLRIEIDQDGEVTTALE